MGKELERSNSTAAFYVCVCVVFFREFFCFLFFCILGACFRSFALVDLRSIGIFWGVFRTVDEKGSVFIGC